MLFNTFPLWEGTSQGYELLFSKHHHYLWFKQRGNSQTSNKTKSLNQLVVKSKQVLVNKSKQVLTVCKEKHTRQTRIDIVDHKIGRKL